MAPQYIYQIEDLSRVYDEKVILKEIWLSFYPGAKIGVLGYNGAGKSTLLRILAGEDKGYTGEVKPAKGIKIGHLSQEPRLDPNATVGECIQQGVAESQAILDRYNELNMKLGEDLSPEEMDAVIAEQAVYQDKIDALNLWELDRSVEIAADALRVPPMDWKIATLSGGEKRRVALCKLLLGNPDLLLLDEPTNHLDAESVEWLEQYLRRQKCTVLLVTHDRYFMESVCQEIYEMSDGKLYRHPGTYTQYLHNKQARQAIEVVDAEKARSRMRSELEWMRRQPKARATKSKAREEAFYRLQEQAKGPQRRGDMQLDVQNQRLGGKILEMAYLRKQFGGRTLIFDFSYLFTRHDRIGVVGPNGAGKSTLLNLIAGNLRPDGGKVEKGDNTRIGYYTQHELEYEPNQTVIGLVRDRADYIKLSDGRELSASSYLNRFLFPPKQQHDLVSKLSGGEKRRLQLLLVLMEGPNLLLLDEPTNDLDLDTLQVIEEFLDEFEGCLMMVSHDRYFMDRLVDHLFVFDGEGQISDFPGNYTEYRNHKKTTKTRLDAPPPIDSPKKTVEPPSQARRLSYREQKELEQTEQLMAELTAEMKRLDALLSEGCGGHEDFARWGQERAECAARMEEAEMRWLELDELRGATL